MRRGEKGVKVERRERERERERERDFKRERERERGIRNVMPREGMLLFVGEAMFCGVEL